MPAVVAVVLVEVRAAKIEVMAATMAEVVM